MRSVITGENLKKHDAVFFYTTGDLQLSDAQKSDLLAFVRKDGKGFGGSHCATDTFYNWKEYGDLIGAYFDGHPWTQKVHILVEDKKSPATKHLGDAFYIDDEIYQFKGPFSRDKLHVLMKLDMDSVKNQGKRADKDNAIAWTHDYGKGHVFYTRSAIAPRSGTMLASSSMCSAGCGICSGWRSKFLSLKGDRKTGIIVSSSLPPP